MEQNNGWISVEDRLPEGGEEILFLPKTESCFNYKQYKVRMGIFLKKDQFYRDNMFCDGAFFEANKIAIWQPIPELPQQFKKTNHHGTTK